MLVLKLNINQNLKCRSKAPVLNACWKGPQRSLCHIWWKKIYLLTIPMIQHKVIQVGLNQSFVSRYRVQTSVFRQNLTFKVLVWPWKWGQDHQNQIILYRFHIHLTKFITVHPTFWQLVRKIKTRNQCFLFYTKEESLPQSLRVILLQQDA